MSLCAAAMMAVSVIAGTPASADVTAAALSEGDDRVALVWHASRPEPHLPASVERATTTEALRIQAAPPRASTPRLRCHQKTGALVGAIAGGVMLAVLPAPIPRVVQAAGGAAAGALIGWWSCGG